MAKFNNYSKFFNQVQKIPFEFLDNEFTVKNSHTNSLIMTEANKTMIALNLEQQRLEKRDATEEEQMELTLKQIEIYAVLENCISRILGEKQFARLQKLELTTDGYMVLFRILFGLIQGLTHEQIIEQLEEEEQENMGEQEKTEEN
jgi:hypothetical protein